MIKSGKKILVGLSGGVDSAVSAALLKEQGWEPIGAHIKAWTLNKDCADKDMKDAESAARALNIPFFVFDFEKEYRKKIVEYFVQSYKAGLTPNPDVLCNKEIKFGVFLEKAKKMGIDFVATGHYARKKENNGRTFLLKGKDSTKDQSYFLWQLDQKQLKAAIFPVGDLEKKQVRILAKKFDLPNAEKKDSQGVCFLGKVELKGFLKKFLKTKPGNIVLADGKKVGQHEGIFFYTIGQRHGFDLAVSKTGLKTEDPLFIIGKNIEKNLLIVGPGRSNPLLNRRVLILEKLNFISEKPEREIAVEAAIRYHQDFQPAILKKFGRFWKLEFESPVWAPALGQSVVFGRGEEIWGGGIIKKIP